MERQEFLAKLGISMAAICTGCSLVGCGSKSNDPSPGTTTNNPPAPGSGTVFSINLATDLQTIGTFKVASGVILVRLAADNVASSFTAVQVACTHQGTSINYNANQGKFICPNHGSQFSTSGAVLLGPAAVSLKQYTVSVNGDTLTVMA
jgi:Rieske Fe-S protein